MSRNALQDREYRLKRKIAGNPVSRGGVEKSFEHSTFCAWDGEAVDGRYVFLASSAHGELYRPGGISTKEAFDFLLSFPRSRFERQVCFGLNYDVNMWLGDLNYDTLLSIWKADRPITFTFAGRWWRILYRPRKEFYLARFRRRGKHWIKTPLGWKPNLDGSIRLFDPWGFFQSSFVGALKAWDIPMSELDFLKEMKAERSRFTAENTEKILDYCRIETRKLEELMRALHRALLDTKIHVSRWDGAGAIAGALFRMHQIKKHVEQIPDKAHMARVRRAYAGGRIEMAKIGRHAARIWQYDIHSAYPSIIARLPSLKGGRWEKRMKFEGGFTLSKIKFNFPYDIVQHAFYPLFYRDCRHAICFPPRGEGWYWGPEVEAALRFSSLTCGPKHGLKILEHYVFCPANDARPFAFVEEIYHERKRLKAQKKGSAEKVLKLGLNSLYGKTAQQLGGTSEKWPSFFQMEWAGYVTSSIRAKLFLKALERPESVISFMTDGFMAMEPFSGPVDESLGGWMVEEYDGVTIGQPGVYWLERGGSVIHRSRGFERRFIEDMNLPLQLWERTKKRWYLDAKLAVPMRRFVGLGKALAERPPLHTWRTWPEELRELDLTGASPKRIFTGDEKRVPWPHERLVGLTPQDNPHPEFESAPYPLRWEKSATEQESEDWFMKKLQEEEVT